MDPDVRAALKRRASMACKEMRQFGFELARTKDALKRLLKMLDYDWDAIEANNYSLLVDTLIASPPDADNSAGEVDFEQAEPIPSASLHDDIAPVEKRQATVLPTEASSLKETDGAVPIPDSFEERYWPRTDPSSVGTRRKGGVVAPLQGSFPLKKPKPEPDVEPAAENVSNSHAMDNLGHTLPSNSQSSAAVAEEDTNKALIPINEHEDQMNPARTVSQKITNTETSAALNKDGSICTQSTVPIGKLHSSTSSYSARTDDKLHATQNDSEVNHEEPSAEPNMVEIDGKGCDNSKKDDPVCSFTAIEIASSSNGKVKMCLSVNTESPNFQLPHINSVLKSVESKYLKIFKIQQPNFSIMDLLKEVCETSAKLDGSAI